MNMLRSFFGGGCFVGANPRNALGGFVGGV